ncbi:PspA-associated protein PspAB [Kribbella swartbergensis]
MGLLDILLGRSKAVPPNLDQLFAVPSAAITLETAAGYRPTGSGSVCFKAAEGGGFSALRAEVDKLLALDGDKFTSHTDSYGFTWLVRQTSPDDVEGLVTDLHAVNTSLVDAGFGSALLCTLVAFTDGSKSLGLVYLYKRGSWYPFVPVGPDRRDNATELQVKSVIDTDLRMEQDLARWFPVYGAPGL